MLVDIIAEYSFNCSMEFEFLGKYMFDVVLNVHKVSIILCKISVRRLINERL